MRRAFLMLAVALAVTACGSGEKSPAGTAVAPKDAPERVTIPAKCKDALTFDQECVELFDKAFGPGAGNNERARLNTERAYGRDPKKSTAKPAPRIGTQQ